MTDRIKRGLDDMVDHYVLVCLFMALFILTLAGVGNVAVTGFLGVLLCIVGAAQPSVKADLWILIPFMIYNLFSLASSYVTYGNLTRGFGGVQIIFPVIYLLMAGLDEKELLLLRKLCVIWAGIVAILGIGEFVYSALSQGAGRLRGIVGGPNSLGSFLVIGWFALLGCSPEQENCKEFFEFWRCIEPFLLIALALTLSLGSFVAMAGGMILLVMIRKRHSSFRETILYAGILLAKASLGFGIGILMYLAADRTDAPWICLLLLAYAVIVAANWRKFERFLAQYSGISGIMASFGVLVAAAAIVIRPSAIATFTERLEMMKNGLGYFGVNPLLGVGPYKWRQLNLYDSDKYFNTYYIHNSFIHAGVELGIPALAMLAVISVRFFRKKRPAAAMAEGAAFFVHNLMESVFFSASILCMAMLTTGQPHEGGKKINVWFTRVIFIVSAAMFAGNIYWFFK